MPNQITAQETKMLSKQEVIDLLNETYPDIEGYDCAHINVGTLVTQVIRPMEDVNVPAKVLKTLVLTLNNK